MWERKVNELLGIILHESATITELIEQWAESVSLYSPSLSEKNICLNNNIAHELKIFCNVAKITWNISKTITLSHTGRIKVACMMGKKGRFVTGLEIKFYNKTLFL